MSNSIDDEAVMAIRHDFNRRVRESMAHAAKEYQMNEPWAAFRRWTSTTYVDDGVTKDIPK